MFSVAERAMYFGTDPIWKGGHGSAGRRLPSTEWFLAEGATGLGFDTFILAMNPFLEPFDVTFTFLPESGEPASVTKTLPARSRLTLNIEAEGNVFVEPTTSPESPATTFGSLIVSDQPIVVERAMYWNVGGQVWAAGTNATGAPIP